MLRVFLFGAAVCMGLCLEVSSQTPEPKKFQITRSPVNREYNSAFRGKQEQEIELLEHQLSDAIKTKDALAFNRLLAENVLIGGVEGTKQQYITLLQQLNTKYASVEKSGMRIQIHGDTAVATGIQKADIDIENGSRFSQSIFINTWRRVDGKWQCIALVN